MASFKAILRYDPEQLLQLLYKFNASDSEDNEKVESIAKKLKLREAQIICAIGFNRHLPELPEIPPILGFKNYDALIHVRNEYFTTDIYKMLTLDNILSIYASIKDNPNIRQVMEYLLATRLMNIEKRIDETVNSLTIDKYKEEMRAIYSDEVVSLDFVENRLQQADSGFRALLNEVSLIVESKIIPAGDIFFRDSILPQEKKKLLDKGLIPKTLIDMRLSDPNISAVEKKILYDYSKTHPSALISLPINWA